MSCSELFRFWKKNPEAEKLIQLHVLDITTGEEEIMTPDEFLKKYGP